MKIVLAIMIATITIHAQRPINVGTGGETGNYFSMTKDVFENYCTESLGREVNIQNTGGSVDNLVGMTQKKFAIGIVQSDVLMNMSKTMPRKVNMNSMKIIAGMHVETVHLLIPQGYAPKKSGGSGLFGKFSSMFSSDNGPVEIKLSSLKDQEVASWGGSIVSAKALSYFFDLNWKIRSISASEGPKTNVPIILVGGAPYAPVEKLLATGKWNLISINYNEIAAKAPFYVKSEATYKVRGNPVTISTVGVQALMIAKSFRKASRNEGMVALATCIDESLADLADDPDTNPNWGSVYENNQQGHAINWSFFQTK